ncbi:BrnT family toxin [Fodinicurvata sp. EGI_FJ10296]|uniref:BrnT family toxin n=1 Tax=Fodinicurvata sp. EGI_FJ10296 TaxID=3231908 RepID=UPI003452C33D
MLGAEREAGGTFAVSEMERIENGEYRWQTIGLVNGCVMLLVAHTVADDDAIERIRIISARRATGHEVKRYERERR